MFPAPFKCIEFYVPFEVPVATTKPKLDVRLFPVPFMNILNWLVAFLFSFAFVPVDCLNWAIQIKCKLQFRTFDSDFELKSCKSISVLLRWSKDFANGWNNVKRECFGTAYLYPRLPLLKQHWIVHLRYWKVIK